MDKLSVIVIMQQIHDEMQKTNLKSFLGSHKNVTIYRKLAYHFKWISNGQPLHEK